MQKAFPIFVMELFCDGWLFLEHSDVTWDGSSHVLKRVHINADKSEWLLSRAREHFTDVPSNIDLCQYVGTTLVELEKHTELVVPRDDVSPRLQLLFEGDLTPITLVQLMCVGATGFRCGRRVKARSALPMTSDWRSRFPGLAFLCGASARCFAHRARC